MGPLILGNDMKLFTQSEIAGHASDTLSPSVGLPVQFRLLLPRLSCLNAFWLRTGLLLHDSEYCLAEALRGDISTA